MDGRRRLMSTRYAALMFGLFAAAFVVALYGVVIADTVAEILLTFAAVLISGLGAAFVAAAWSTPT